MAETIARVSDVPVSVRDSWDPTKCPVGLLPWLAWAYSVDEWDPNWPEATRRDVIRQSQFVHKKKGTLSAVVSSMSTLGYTTRIVEWFTNSATPFTFEVDIESSQLAITESAIAKASQLIDVAKNERSHYTFNVIGRSDCKFYLGAATVCGDVVEILPA